MKWRTSCPVSWDSWKNCKNPHNRKWSCWGRRSWSFFFRQCRPLWRQVPFLRNWKTFFWFFAHPFESRLGFLCRKFRLRGKCRFLHPKRRISRLRNSSSGAPDLPVRPWNWVRLLLKVQSPNRPILRSRCPFRWDWCRRRGCWGRFPHWWSNLLPRGWYRLPLRWWLWF